MFVFFGRIKFSSQYLISNSWNMRIILSPLSLKWKKKNFVRGNEKFEKNYRERLFLFRNIFYSFIPTRCVLKIVLFFYNWAVLDVQLATNINYIICQLLTFHYRQKPEYFDKIPFSVCANKRFPILSNGYGRFLL